MAKKATRPKYDSRSTWLPSPASPDGIPSYHSPAEIGECPYVMTGNADERWDTFMVDCWQFAMWASETMTDEKTGEKFNPISGGKPWTFSMSGLQHGNQDVVNGRTLDTVDGITIVAGDFAADIFMHFCELMGKLPCCYPDGDLLFTSQPGADRVVLHLWHD